ncbi:2-phospho-L-lactate guanylyltransferase [Halorhabdus amylolytica]|uniref:2-phospho-L-lactate guanylyltransferase n=1 Tax=Halorhabdus amylolytica TaxID=2559573 RepID=UPI0010AA79B0|nr:2-phospho-L-lactate guanylyltransferase [Halorhabdus amylolytica]
MRIFVPFDASESKTRLDPVLAPDERMDFARAMLADVLAAIEGTGGDPTVVATEPIDMQVPVTVDERPLDDAVNDRLADAVVPTAVIMSDLPLVTPETIDRLFSVDGEVVLAPGRGGGTNALVTRHPDFRVDYHDASIRDHRAIATKIGVDPIEVDSYRLGTDIDEPEDLAEVLLHSEGQASRWLRERGFEIAIEPGRVGIKR